MDDERAVGLSRMLSAYNYQNWLFYLPVLLNDQQRNIHASQWLPQTLEFYEIQGVLSLQSFQLFYVMLKTWICIGLSVRTENFVVSLVKLVSEWKWHVVSGLLGVLLIDFLWVGRFVPHDVSSILVPANLVVVLVCLQWPKWWLHTFREQRLLFRKIYYS